MRFHIKIYKTIITAYLLLVGFSLLAGENDPLIEKRKNWSKSYNISNSDKIIIHNQFGEVKVTTWNRNEVKVDVVIIGKSSSEERAQQILDRISIKDERSNNYVSFKTQLENKNEKNKKGEWKEEGMEINYTVNMPAANALQLSNDFGATLLPDLNGSTDITSKFGSLVTGSLSNNKQITVEFGKADIGDVNNGAITIKFSKANFKNLRGDIKANFEFSDASRIYIDNDLRNLSIKNSYSQMQLDLSKDLSASFDISTSFGELTNKSNFDIKKDKEKEEDYGPVFDHRYRGVAGNGTAKIIAKCSYGQITMGHNLPIDIHSKGKPKKEKVI